VRDKTKICSDSLILRILFSSGPFLSKNGPELNIFLLYLAATLFSTDHESSIYNLLYGGFKKKDMYSKPRKCLFCENGPELNISFSTTNLDVADHWLGTGHKNT
jgi:hypothetical protein